MSAISVAIEAAGSRVDLVQPSRLMIPTESAFSTWCLRKTIDSQHTSDGDIAWQVVDYVVDRLYFFIFLFFHLTYSRWTSSLPSCLRSQRIFPSLPGSRQTIFYRDASSALLQLVNQWLNFTYSRSHAFRYERKSTNPSLARIEPTTSALAGVQVTYWTTRAKEEIRKVCCFSRSRGSAPGQCCWIEKIRKEE